MTLGLAALMIALPGFTPPAAAGSDAPAVQNPPDATPEALDAEIGQWRQEAAAAGQAGDHAHAAEATAHIVALVKRRNGERSGDYAGALVDRALELRSLGRAGEAEPLDRQALTLYTDMGGEKDVSTILSLGYLAADLRALGRFAEAEPFDRKALKLSTEVSGEKYRYTILCIIRLADDLRALGRFAEAEPLDRKAVAYGAEVLGPKRPLTLHSLANLALDLRRLDRAAEAEPLDRHALQLCGETLGETHACTLTSLNNLAVDLDGQGRDAEAEPLQRRGFELTIRVSGEKHPNTITSMGNLAGTLRSLGRAGEAEALDRRAFALATETLGEKHPETLRSLSSLALDLNALGRPAEAMALIRRVAALRAEVLGDKHRDELASLSDLAANLQDMGRAAEAEPLDRRVLALRTEILGEKHPDTLASLNNLAAVLNALGRTAEAEQLDRRALALNTELFGEKHPATVTSLNNLAGDLVGLGRAAEAEPLYRRVLALNTELFGDSHPRTVESLGTLALTLLLQRDRAALALEPARQAVDGIRAARKLVGDSARAEAQLSRDTLSQADFFKLLADADWSTATAARDQSPALLAEAFGALQDAMAGTASRAVVLAAARRLAESTSPELGAIAAERQALSDQWRGTDALLTRALGEGGPDAALKRVNLEKREKMIEARMAAIDAQLGKQAPAYFAMTRPEALTPDQTQAMLRPDEAVLMIVPSVSGTQIMAVTSAGTLWVRAPLVAATIRTMVKKLRADLDPDGTATDTGWHYDRKTAHALYQALIVPVLPALHGKKQLFIAADGALASLPFGVLVSREPEGKDDDLAALKSTGWLEDDFALIQLPSIQSLYYLRTFGARQPASRGIAPTFVGFGDPVLAGVALLRGKGTSRRITPASIAGVGVTRDGGALADIASIRELPSLPGTRTELENLGHAIGAPASALHLGVDATESRVRSMPLADDRIIAFATHGVMAGEISGVAEPGLILTPPQQPSSDDDGYLSASEITGLKLNADWVILSACNTAAGDGTGAPGLTGLARAFFYAGARSLLASHWPVLDAVAPRITTDTIQRQQANPALTRAEALQQAVEAIRNDASDPTNAHPSVWAPLVLVGDSQ